MIDLREPVISPGVVDLDLGEPVTSPGVVDLDLREPVTSPGVMTPTEHQTRVLPDEAHWLTSDLKQKLVASAVNQVGARGQARYNAIDG